MNDIYHPKDGCELKSVVLGRAASKKKASEPSAAPPCSANCSVCDWQQEEEGQWETDCDETFEFQEGGPLDNGFEWCPYCGKKLVETIYSEPQNAPGDAPAES